MHLNRTLRVRHIYKVERVKWHIIITRQFLLIRIKLGEGIFKKYKGLCLLEPVGRDSWISLYEKPHYDVILTSSIVVKFIRFFQKNTKSIWTHEDGISEEKISLPEKALFLSFFFPDKIAVKILHFFKNQHLKWWKRWSLKPVGL